MEEERMQRFDNGQIGNSDGLKIAAAKRIAESMENRAEPREVKAFEIPAKIDRLFYTTEELSKYLAVLQGRLAPVSHTVPEADCRVQHAEGSTGTELGSQLETIAIRMQLMIHAVAEMTERLAI
jgi:hypothetical protein